MELYNPFEPVSKGIESPPVTRLRALVPTGAHIGHGNDLHVTRHSGHGGPATALQVYRHKSRGHRQGPFGKAAGSGVARGLDSIARMKPPTRVPMTPQSAGPGAGAGSNLTRRRLSMERLQSQVGKSAMPGFRPVNSFTRGEKLLTNMTYGSKGDTQVVLKKPKQARANQAAVNNGLNMIRNMPKPTGVPSSPSSAGRAFQNPSSAGRRFT